MRLAQKTQVAFCIARASSRLSIPLRYHQSYYPPCAKGGFFFIPNLTFLLCILTKIIRISLYNLCLENNGYIMLKYNTRKFI